MIAWSSGLLPCVSNRRLTLQRLTDLNRQIRFFLES
jgi:hypothetical protein